MFEGKRIGVVIPAYNEEKLIGRVIETMPDFVDRMYVIDDVSTDATSERVLAFCDSCGDRLELIRHEVNQGVGAAITTGYRKALADGMQVIAVMAGDAQMDPDELGKVISPVVRGEADYVKGNRLFTGEAWKLIPRYRYLGNAFLSLVTKFASGYWHVADSQTGYTAVSADTLRLMPLELLYPRYGYPNHLLVMLNIFDQRVKDVPVRPVYNIGETSGIRLKKVIPRMSWLLVKCFFWRMKEKYIIRDFHPLIFFYLMGFSLFPLGLLSGLYLFLHRILTGPVASTSALFAVFLFVSGLQSLFFGMWFDMEYNKDLKIK
ncbi:MAG: glycosyltransferase family 2 protein [Syntrophobacteraceae bacterium]|nr:glycosyltransferase family 2 protein [Desulfobacteraceae bacterium]